MVGYLERLLENSLHHDIEVSLRPHRLFPWSPFLVARFGYCGYYIFTLKVYDDLLFCSFAKQ